MLWDNCKAELKIMKVDNGYILEWETKRTKPSSPAYLQQMGGQPEFDPRGKEIIAKPADLLKRIKELV